MSAITNIEQHLGVPLLSDLCALYERAHDDRDWDEDERGPFYSSQGLPMRLMSSAEVIRLFDSFRGRINLYGSAGFWQGRNGTYAFAFVTGPLQGRVYFWDYDGRNTSIAFRSIPSFYEALEEAGEQQIDWYQMPTDYFIQSQYYYHGAAVCRPASPDDIAADLVAREELLREYTPENVQTEFDEHHYAFNIMALTPPERTADVMRFLRSSDMWVRAYACEILGNRQYEPAVEQLAEAARSGSGAAQRALQRIRSARRDTDREAK
jgi:hypothetical protein